MNTAQKMIMEMFSHRAGAHSSMFKYQAPRGAKRYGSRYNPHQGHQEKARRVRQRERGII